MPAKYSESAYACSFIVINIVHGVHYRQEEKHHNEARQTKNSARKSQCHTCHKTHTL